MIASRYRTIPSYRNAIGSPRAGVLTAHRSSRSLISRIRLETDGVRLFSQQAMIDQYALLRQRVAAGEPVTSLDIVCRCYALATEAMRRAKGMVYYDAQLLGGLVLAVGAIAEIQTGEGKTITTGLPAILHALNGKGVHVSTTNDYLSARDHEELQGVFSQLGLTSGLLESQGPVPDKIAAYACDITYGPGYEFGFDFLKDQLAIRSRFKEPMGERFLRSLQGVAINTAPLTQRGHAFAIVDEADSVLIDEATTPLIMSGGNHGIRTSPSLFAFAKDVADSLGDADFQVERERKRITLTDAGWASIHESYAQRPPGRLSRQWSKLIENSLRATHILVRDVDYVIQNQKVMIVDQNTGRIHDERTWSSGLHQAVEMKESVPLTPENETQARITRQRYSGFYSGMCGLTGTASGGESELRTFYALPVVRIDTHRPCIRKTLPTRSFADFRAKFEAIADDTASRRQSGQAVLIGTRTILESNQLSELLTRKQVKHVVLNGTQSEDEADLIAKAGAAGSVTVATNMAGRGTDIRLSDMVKQAGGLHVVATEFHHSKRVDRQLVGRAARQGDPGSCQFFASAEDELIAANAPDLAARMTKAADEQGQCRGDFHDAISRVQSRVERRAFQSRQEMVEYDDWLESVQSSLARSA
ncbi:helicase-related protein [Planctomycetes bacterium K23_9]|uniref:Protein translocase subunit SecA n=1 Tax=Stieleria marina TaxID=1930275 RepID=A0A517P134_9BACT|nr:preprotein translocase subunit SecA [Planctomycetes bacterium K23_9]